MICNKSRNFMKFKSNHDQNFRIKLNHIQQKVVHCKYLQLWFSFNGSRRHTSRNNIKNMQQVKRKLLMFNSRANNLGALVVCKWFCFSELRRSCTIGQNYTQNTQNYFAKGNVERQTLEFGYLLLGMYNIFVHKWS